MSGIWIRFTGPTAFREQRILMRDLSRRGANFTSSPNQADFPLYQRQQRRFTGIDGGWLHAGDYRTTVKVSSQRRGVKGLSVVPRCGVYSRKGRR